MDSNNYLTFATSLKLAIYIIAILF